MVGSKGVVMRKLLLGLMLAQGVIYAEEPKPPAPKQWLKDQHDQTDVYSIPLDSSEEEERQEMKELQKQEQSQQK